jgi:PIN domain nuclease of toxin-antitoxin system
MRTILIDTHILLWAIFDDSKINSNHKEILKNPENRILVSTISPFEISIKKSIGNLSFPHKPGELIALIGFEELPILPQHLNMVEEVNWFHKDPFDKMIIAQALSEDLEIISYDVQFKQYNLKLI